MRETPLSNCERAFLLKCIQEKKRLDGRQTYDYRNLKITFGTDYGCCTVSLGKSRVLAQVSCELVPPKDSRPTEGIMFFNLELSPMASPGFQSNRQSELLVTLNRQLERCLRNSRCIDTESLCVISGEKVWQIRVDVHILNHDGNLMDVASVAAISALSHFRRPEVAIQGRDVTVFSPEERDPVPLSVYHMPVCVSFAFFQQGKDGGKFGFAESVAKERITVLTREETTLDTTDVHATAENVLSKADAPPEVVPSPVIVATGTGQVGEGLQNAWGLEEEDDDEEEEMSDAAKQKKKKDEVMVISDSEEEEVMILNQDLK
ncbi:Exosome complex component RRP45 [Bagarius yarrelli]|uniref:Exosome complex component RRP45 n=1 Tax=Bagarius yarrelli TaxID=175774 RepID=A0A556UG03_BAGYA|nr:Exosome complex component RRP45 [Bagarius yarrelli]